MANSTRVHEQEDNDFVQYAKYTAKTYLLMMKNHFKSSSFYLGNLAIPIVVTLATCILFPIWFGFIWSLFISMSFAAFSAYGTLLFSIRKSTLKKNIDMTAAESSALYSAMLLVILTVTLITFNIIFGMVLLGDLDEFQILSHQFFFQPDVSDTTYIDWSKVGFDLIFYYWFTQGLVTFSMSFFIERISSNQKNFFIIIFIYLLGGMFFSGIWSPTIYSNTGFIAEKGLAPDGVAEGQYFIPTANFVNNKWIGDDYVAGAIASNQKGGTLWWIGQLWPHYGLNQVAFDSIKTGWFDSVSGNYMVEGTRIWSHLGDDPMISYYFAMPWIYTFLGLWIGGMIARFGDK